MNENINIAKILKNVPKGTKLWSPICGECKLLYITSGVYPIGVSTEENDSRTFTFMSNGWYADYPNAECLLFPSKENRDWSTFKAPWKHKSFKPFQKVLIPGIIDNVYYWSANLYSYYNKKYRVHVLIDSETINNDDYILPYEGNEDKLGEQIE